MTKIRNFAMICLMALFVVYCGTAVLASVYNTVNLKENLSVALTFTKNSAPRPGLIALGDPINDPRPHQN